MKNVILLTILFSMHYYASAQTDVGIKGGVNLTFFTENQEQFGERPETEFGYFGGLFVDFTVSENFHIQPEVLYKGVGEFRFINAPLYAEYYVSNDLSLLVGPSINYFFDFFTTKFKVRADVSAAYHFSDNVELNLKYTLGLEELSPNVLFLGLGYSF
ncbi:PorT family protein [Rasiella rasia]|uniref:PorT family protein n=1 Tax=Rasiella rasia TaxID=2744027 RepID=A0A6G6GLH1_9FLAO|nr:outer membrane beta-barrel protein [Rasiella rasia]QIE58541.1 PorT family protein [Rasiella rasia]